MLALLILAGLAQTVDPEQSMRLGRDALAAGRFEEAIAQYGKARAALPNNAGILLNLCIANHSAAHYDKAIAWCEKIPKQDAAYAPAGLFLGLAQLKLDRPAQAIAPLERFLRSQPNQPNAILELALARAAVERRRKHHKDAIGIYREALTKLPSNPNLERELALSLFQDRDYENALPLLQRHEMYFELGVAALETGDAAGAVAPLERVSDRPDAQAPLGNAYLKSGQPEKAIPHLLAAANEDLDGSIHLQLARAYQRTGQTQQAEAAQAMYLQLSRKSK